MSRLMFDSFNDKIWKQGWPNNSQEFFFLFSETFKLWSVFLWSKIKRLTLFNIPQSFCSATIKNTAYGGYLGPSIWILFLEELYYHKTVASMLFSFSFLPPSLNSYRIIPWCRWELLYFYARYSYTTKN